MILYLGNKLSDHGFTPTSVETLGLRLHELGFEVVTKSSKRNKLLRLSDMVFTIFKLRKLNPVVVIDTYSSSAFWYSWISAFVSNKLNLKYIPILRGGDLPKRLDNSQWASSILFNNSYANIAISGYMKEAFIKRNFSVQEIHNYIDLNYYPHLIRQEIRPRLLWVRSFHQTYNPQMAIQVLKKLTIEYPHATLCMVGPDKDNSLAECKKMAEELNVEVVFTGRMSKNEWIKLSENYDVFINTTNVDNTPVSVMEAMALGMPVVTTNPGGIPFLFKNREEGIMVSVNSVSEMKNAIISIINNPSEGKRLSIAARKKAEEWDWSIIGDKWKKLISDSKN